MWQNCKSWNEVFTNEKYKDEYLKFLENFRYYEFDWTDISKKLLKYAEQNIEYGGIIKVNKKNKLYISHILKGKEHNIKLPDDMPGVFIFHTHPSHCINMNCIPSGADVIKSYEHAYEYKYLADILVSRYGIFKYTIPESILTKMTSLKLCYGYAYYTCLLLKSFYGREDVISLDKIFVLLRDHGFIIYPIYKTRQYSNHRFFNELTEEYLTNVTTKEAEFSIIPLLKELKKKK
jgi:hypothetical protein